VQRRGQGRRISASRAAGVGLPRADKTSPHTTCSQAARHDSTSIQHDNMSPGVRAIAPAVILRATPYDLVRSRASAPSHGRSVARRLLFCGAATFTSAGGFGGAGATTRNSSQKSCHHTREHEDEGCRAHRTHLSGSTTPSPRRPGESTTRSPGISRRTSDANGYFCVRKTTSLCLAAAAAACRSRAGPARGRWAARSITTSDSTSSRKRTAGASRSPRARRTAPSPRVRRRRSGIVFEKNVRSFLCSTSRRHASSTYRLTSALVSKYAHEATRGPRDRRRSYRTAACL